MFDVSAIRNGSRMDLVGRATDGSVRHLAWSSDPLIEFLLTLADMTPAQRQQFLQFLAGLKALDSWGF